MDHLEVTALILTSLAFYSTAAIIVIVALRMHYKRRELLSREIITAIEKGAEIPLPAPGERNYRNQGLIWLLTGIALFIALWVTLGELTAAVWGLLPVALGTALLLIHRFQAREARDQS